MGLSSSQARLLNLTARMHQIEYKAARLEAQKLQMANDSKRVYNDYLNALEAVKLQSKAMNADGSITYVDATYRNLIGKVYGNEMYLLTDTKTGKLYLPEQYKDAYECSNKTLDGFLKTLSSIVSSDSDTYIPVNSQADLMAIAESGGNYKLESDIVLNDWSGISNFCGTLDGNGHTITINGSNGLFETLNGATIKNVSINANIKNEDESVSYTGGLVGYANNTTIDNCYVEGSVYSVKRAVGGLAGAIKGNCTITNSDTCVNVYSDYTSVDNGQSAIDYFGRCGGFIGYILKGSVTEINDCSSTGGSVNYTLWQAGGFIGQANGDVTLNGCVVDNAVTVNYNGKGDNYAESINVDGRDYRVPRNGSTFIGFINSGNFTANDCNIYGDVSTGGNTAFEDVTYGYADSVTSKSFNNCYSPNENWSENPNSSSGINKINYPNIDDAEMDQAIGVFVAIEEAQGVLEPPEDCLDSVTWLSNVINNGSATLLKVDIRNRQIYDTSVATDTNLREVDDEVLLKKAEAKYEADMKRIDMKDRKYDTDLAALESERNAIKQEMETLKTVAKDNVERTFKLFG